ncbi:PadR family transcriptional regulator [Rathayibacter rathayi]|uniref:PadR family transcriptional regulator n=1 Tax=Rathayibacter rathayi TaxID=33887 RepID=UPI000CE93680|nr:PadR family transcriptional regulator [Rathayibacter rathayi]PPG98305.1 PadR family transcriptional regulator [Rathayibacter rathayi]
MQMTHSLVSVAVALLSAPDAKHWGYDLSKQTGVRSGVLYPILGRLLDNGWLEDGWEEPETLKGKRRPPRRYYTVTPEGLAELGAVAQQAQTQQRFAGFRTQVAL